LPLGSCPGALGAAPGPARIICRLPGTACFPVLASLLTRQRRRTQRYRWHLRFVTLFDEMRTTTVFATSRTGR
jgi:hypothetical protein